MPPSSGELWGYNFMPNRLHVDFLMPTGVIISMLCEREANLEVIKGNLWLEAKHYPLYHLLGDPSCYIFISITADAEKEEFYDESRRLCDLRLFQPILKLIEPEGNKEEKIINYQIGLAIGVPVHEFDEMRNNEVQDFRRNMLHVCINATETRDSSGQVSQATYVYPPEIESSHELPPYLDKKLNEGMVMIKIWAKVGGDKQKYTIKVPKDSYPESIIAEAILKKIKMIGLTKEEQYQRVREHQNNYILKVCGCDEFFLGNYPICQYKYIRRCIARGDIPALMLLSRDTVMDCLGPTNIRIPAYMRRGTSHSNGQTKSLWRMDKYLHLKVLWATNVNVGDVDQIYVRVGLFHGMEPLCEAKNTERKPATHPEWHQGLEFPISMPDIPRCAKLCLSICSVTKRKRKEEECMLAWGNINLMDYKNILLSGRHSVNLWQVGKGMDEQLNPIGVVGSNPNSDSPCLQLEFDHYGIVLFPSSQEISEYADFLGQLSQEKVHLHGTTNPHYKQQHVMAEQTTEADMDQIREITARDPLTELSQQEQEFLWRHRKNCFLVPNSLPRLLDSLKWNSRDEVAHMYEILKEWPSVHPETALELLDCKYADSRVREAAVGWLDHALDDEKLSLYLLQLVATLKHEQYLDNPLSCFLLRRALLNRKIGHFFFWHLKSEMTEQATSQRFGLILEAFCRGLGDQLQNVVGQVQAMEKLIKLTDSLKERKDDNQRDRIKYLCEQLRQNDYQECLQNIPSPLNISHILGMLLIERCKIMDSAKRPLHLVWSNPDPMATEYHTDEFAIIFKNGDDLRQDMLTLQVIRIMDQLWLQAGLDLRMLPYNCLATGLQVGMIEVVRKAKTVYGIQRKAGTLAAIQVDSKQLHRWIKEHNKNTYDQAIETFTYSCAGYCVATFVLGIGDRNPDNIMVNEQGQIFHIDFGHFLGHFKKKFGINRERVPFVLTDDFLYVISRGQENPKKSKEFQKFHELCGLAYVTLRRHADLLISLFTMMLSTGIPELQSIDDVSYLRKTLAVEMSEEEAIQYFQNQFNDAYGGAWTTKLDWFFHSVRHM